MQVTFTKDRIHYILHYFKKDWSSAQKHCKQIGGDLVTVSTQAKMDSIEQNLRILGKKKKKVPYWIEATAGKMTYKCAYSVNSRYYWQGNDAACKFKIYFMCEVSEDEKY